MTNRVLVTGGASGLGAALVDEFLKRGDRVLVTDLADEYAPPAGAEYLRLDVTSDANWENARQWVESTWGGLDILVNNAGIAAGGRVDAVSFAEWQRGVEINLYGVVRGCRTFVPMMKCQEGGHIVNTASMAGLVHPPAMGPYTAAKAGVVAVSESLFFELSPWQIKVQAVCPSYFRTNLASSFSGEDPVAAFMIGNLVDKSPLGADDIAAIVVAGMETDEPLILTDEVGRSAYRDKHSDPETYRRQQHGYGAKIRAATDEMKDSND